MEDIIKIVKDSFSINDCCLKLYGYCNGRTIKKIKKIIEEENLDISHFDSGIKKRKYEKIVKICLICGENFETSIGSRDEKTTCSSRCANFYFQHGRNNPDFDKEGYKERYNKVSKSLKGLGRERFKEKRFCKICGIDITHKRKKNIFCSNLCRGKFPKSDETITKIKNGVNERIKNGTHNGWQSRNIESYPETFFKKVLNNNKIEYEFNKPIKKRDLGIDCDSNYFLDFYIKVGNIDLEIDGSQHRYRINHDELRDKSLLNNGFNVYRIKWKSVNNNAGKEYIKNEIDKFIEYYNNIGA